MHQRLTLVGNLGADPELRYTGSGEAVCNFSMAVNRKWNTDDGQRQETTWFRITVWGSQGEVVNQYLSKGRPVLIEGRLNPDPKTGGPRIWTTQEGEARTSYEVTAHTVRFLGGGVASESQAHGASVGAGEPDEEDEIPF